MPEIQKIKGKFEAVIVIFGALIAWVYSISRVLEDDWFSFSIAMFTAVILGHLGSDMWKQA